MVKGDAKCLCIAAASVIAKVTRDRLMLQMHERWPQYNFAGGWVRGLGWVRCGGLASGRAQSLTAAACCAAWR